MNKLNNRRSIAVRLSHRELRLMRRLSFDAKRTGGRKLSVSLFLRALIRFLKELKIDVRNIENLEKFTRHLRQTRRKGGKLK